MIHLTHRFFRENVLARWTATKVSVLARHPHLDDDFEQKLLRAPQLKSPAGSIHP